MSNSVTSFDPAIVRNHWGGDEYVYIYNGYPVCCHWIQITMGDFRIHRLRGLKYLFLFQGVEFFE